MTIFNTECPNCGETVRRGAKFCAKCGTPLAATCPHCHQELPPGAKFCKGCGREVNLKETTEQMRRDERNEPIVFRKMENLFARRESLAEPHRIISIGLVIDPGLIAHVYVNGKLEVIVHEGKYLSEDIIKRAKELEGWFRKYREFLERLKNGRRVDGSYPEAFAIVFDSAQVTVSPVIEGLLTSDPLRVTVGIDAYVQLSDASQFVANTLRGRDSYSIQNLTEDISTAIRPEAEKLCCGYTAAELSPGQAKLDELSSALLGEVDRVIENTGYQISGVRSLRVTEAGLMQAADTLADAAEEEAQRSAEIQREQVAVDHETEQLSLERQRVDNQATQETHVLDTQQKLDLNQEARGQEQERRKRESARENLVDDMATERMSSEFKRSESVEDAKTAARKADIADEQTNRARERDFGMRVKESELKQKEDEADFQRFMAMQEQMAVHDEKIKSIESTVEIEKARADRDHFEESKEMLERQAELVARMSRDQGDTLAGLAGKMADALSNAAGAQNQLQKDHQQDVKDIASKSVEGMARVAGSKAIGEGFAKAVVIACVQCGVSLEPDSQFCPECGTKMEDR